MSENQLYDCNETIKTIAQSNCSDNSLCFHASSVQNPALKNIGEAEVHYEKVHEKEKKKLTNASLRMYV